MDDRARQPRQNPRFALTVDVEEWFTGVADRPHELDRFESRLHVGMSRCLELFERAHTQATFFFLGYLAERFPSWVKRVADAGHEVAVHGQYHVPIGQLTPSEFRSSVTRAREALLAAGAPRVSGFRAPVFSLDSRTAWALDVLEELGFEYDSSLFPIYNPRYGEPHAPRLPFRPTRSGKLVEFPMSTANVLGLRMPFSGGFYLRALPLSLVQLGFRRCLEQREPAVCYVHPWELDPEQPPLPGSRLARLRHRVGLDGVGAKLEALLSEFEFAPMTEVLRWHAASTKQPLLRLLRPLPGLPRPDTGQPHT
ncbi:MAG: DUF3473 domain-containing protein [Polyangiaceae bacterium]